MISIRIGIYPVCARLFFFILFIYYNVKCQKGDTKSMCRKPYIPIYWKYLRSIKDTKNRNVIGCAPCDEN